MGKRARQGERQPQVEEDKRRKKRKRRAEKRAGDLEVNQAEHDAVLQALRQVAWTDVVNTGRKNVIDPNRSQKTDKGRAFCQSFILGPNMKSPDMEPSYWTEQHPELYRLLRQLMSKYDPKHQFTNITINRNFRCKPHRDRGNEGKSYIIGFGQYSGGELNIERLGSKGGGAGDEPCREYDTVNIFRRFVPFYGGQQTHFTNEFTGERFSCVFYNFPTPHKKGLLQQKHARVVKPKDVPAALVSKLEQYKKRLKQKR